MLIVEQPKNLAQHVGRAFRERNWFQSWFQRRPI